MSTPRPDASFPSLPNLPAPIAGSTAGSTANSASVAEIDRPYLVRTVRQSDLPLLADVLASSFHTQDGWMGWLYPILRAGIYEDLKTRLQNRTRHYACLVAVKPGLRQSPGLTADPALTRVAGKGDVLMGTVELSLKTPPMIQPWKDKYLYLSNLAVKTEYRHRGVAQELLKTCERIALDWGFEELYLHVLENNDAAQRLYWRAGYRMQRTEISPFSLLLGQPRQLFLHKRLGRE